MPSTSSLELVERARAWPGVLPVRYAAGELIFPAGGFATGVYLLEEGLVGLSPKREGPKPVFHLVGPGEFLGLEGWLKEKRPRYRAAARALTPANLLFFPPPVWEKAVADAEFRNLIFSTLGQMWANFLAKDWELGDGQRAVLWAFQRWGERTPRGLCLPLTPGLLAQALGLSRTTVKQALARLDVAQEGEVLVMRKLPSSQGFLDDVEVELGSAGQVL